MESNCVQYFSRIETVSMKTIISKLYFWHCKNFVRDKNTHSIQSADKTECKKMRAVQWLLCQYQWHQLIREFRVRSKDTGPIVIKINFHYRHNNSVLNCAAFSEKWFVGRLQNWHVQNAFTVAFPKSLFFIFAPSNLDIQINFAHKHNHKKKPEKQLTLTNCLFVHIELQLIFSCAPNFHLYIFGAVFLCLHRPLLLFSANKYCNSIDCIGIIVLIASWTLYQTKNATQLNV